MRSKRHQLRSELRTHLLNVLEERGLSNTPSNFLFSERSETKNTQEYANSLRLQIEEQQRKNHLYDEELERDYDPIPFYEIRKTPRNFPRLNPEEHRRILLEQMEEARKKQEEAQQKEEDFNKLDDFWNTSSNNNYEYDLMAQIEQNKKSTEEIEKKIRLLTKQLEKLKENQVRLENQIQKDVQVSKAVSNISKDMLSSSQDYYQKVAVEQKTPNNNNEVNAARKIAHSEVEMLKPLNVVSKYFVYVAKPRELISPPPQEIDQRENSSIYEEPTSRLDADSSGDDRSSSDSEDDDDEEEEEEEATSEAARAALARADSSSSEDQGSKTKDFRTDLSINSFLEGDVPVSTPHSRFSASSFGS